MREKEKIDLSNNIYVFWFSFRPLFVCSSAPIIMHCCYMYNCARNNNNWFFHSQHIKANFFFSIFAVRSFGSDEICAIRVVRSFFLVELFQRCFSV